MKANECPPRSNLQLSDIYCSSFIMENHWLELDLCSLKSPRLIEKTVTLTDVLDSFQEVNTNAQNMNFSIKDTHKEKAP